MVTLCVSFRASMTSSPGLLKAKGFTVEAEAMSLVAATVFGSGAAVSVGSFTAGLTERSSGPTLPSMVSEPWIAVAAMCGCTGKNFSCWFGSGGGAAGSAVTLTTNGLNQFVLLKVTNAGVVPAAAVKRAASPGSALVTSVWPSVMRETRTSAVG